MQPYFFPYIGYFQLINAVDEYVVLDDVNYIKGGWINRNRILVNNDIFLLGINVQNASYLKTINGLSVLNKNNQKILKTIKFSYNKAPFFEEVYPLIEDIINYENTNLAQYVTNSIVKTARFLGIDTEFFISSEIQKDESLRGKYRVLDICKEFGASQYYNAIGGKELYTKEFFEKEDIELKFLKTNFVEYKQFGSEFISALSIIDVMMFNSVAEIKKMLNMYDLE